jgi:hypothetical protein
MENKIYYKPIEGYENYMIGRNSDIYNIKTGRKLKQSLISGGYYGCSLGGNGQKTISIHRLLAIAYIPNDNPSRTQVDHIDRCRTNNNINNLRWVTHQENMMNKVYKHISYQVKSNTYIVNYTDATSHKHQKHFKQLQDAESYLQELKKDYPKFVSCS